MEDTNLNQEENLVNSSTDNTREKIRKKWPLSLTATCHEHDVAIKYLYKSVAFNVISLFIILGLIVALIITTTSSQNNQAESMCELCPNIDALKLHHVYNITDNICCLREQYIKSQYGELEKGVWKNRTS